MAHWLMHPPARIPDATSLHEAALRHLARYACSAAGLTRVLDRRVARWAREAEPPPEQRAAVRQTVRQVVTRLTAAGVLDDAGFAQARAKTLARAGRSRRAISAHLAARGVAASLTAAVLPSDPEHELAAAVLLARRRRIGPFAAAPAPADPVAQRRALAVLARGGFAEGLARLALGMERQAAEALLIRVRQER